MLSRILLPDPALPASKRWIGILFRLAIVLGIPWAVFNQRTNSFLNSDRFSRLVEDGLRQRLGAESVVVEPFWWNQEKASTSRIEVHFGEASPVASVLMEQVEFSLPTRERFMSVWEIDRMRIRNMEVVVRGAARQEDEAAGESLVMGGLFSIDPKIEATVIPYTKVEHLDIRWGEGEFNSGSLEDAAVTFVPMGKGGVWKVNLKGGMLNQNWIRGIEIEEADLEWDGRQLVCESAQLRMPMGGRGGLGFVLESAGLAIDATIDLKDTDLRQLLDTYNQQYFSGRVSGRIRIAGTLEAGQALTSEVLLTPARDCYCRGIAFFEELGRVTLNPSLGNLPIESGELSLRAVGGDLEDIVASFAVGSVGQLKFSARATDQVFSGTAEIGIEEFVLRRTPELKEEIFSPSQNGWWTKHLDVDGSIKQWFLKDTEKVWMLSKQKSAVRGRDKGQRLPGAKHAPGDGFPEESRRAEPVELPVD